MFKAPDARVLTVDDQEVNLKVVNALLSGYEISCDMANSGMEAIRMVCEREYDLVFMDHMMPEMDGLETVKNIRSLGGRYEKLPILALTAREVSVTEAMYIAAGMNGYLLKPLNTKLLEQSLKKWLPPEKIAITDYKPDDKKKTEYIRSVKCAMEIDWLDVPEGVARVNGDQEAYERSLKILARRIPELVTTLSQNLTSDRLDAFAIDVHGLKGSLANIGESRCCAIAKELELAAKEGDIDYCIRAFTEFNVKISEFSNMLTDVFTEDIGDAREKRSNDFLHDSLKNVIINLENFNRSSALKTLKDILSYSYNEETDKQLVDLNNAVEAYDYSLGVDIAKGLIGNG